MRCKGRFLLVIAVLMIAFSQAGPVSAASATQPFGKGHTIKAFSLEGISARSPVLLRGVVSQTIPEWWAFSLQDSTDGIYVAVGKALPGCLSSRRLVEVKGWTATGKFASIVRAEDIRIAGTA
jgi:hypothetical protein